MDEKDEHKEKTAKSKSSINDNKEKAIRSRSLLPFELAIISGAMAIVSGILTIVNNIDILTFNSQSVLSTLNSSVNSSTAAYLSLAFNGISSVKNGIITFGPLLIIAGIFMIISAFYLKSENEASRKFGIFLVFLFSLFAVLGLLIYTPFNSLTVLILVYLPLTVIGGLTYGLFLGYMILGLITGAIALLKTEDKK